MRKRIFAVLGFASDRSAGASLPELAVANSVEQGFVILSGTAIPAFGAC
jgi:hypothetical protein